MDFDEETLKSNALRQVRIEASVLLKIMKHCRDQTVTGNGQLLGMELDGVLEITHCFPVATKSADDEVNETEDSDYQLNMMRNLRQLNFDANSVGWYQSTYLGSHWNQVLIETQYEYQKALEHAIVLMYDPTQTLSGAVSLKAIRLTDEFMQLFAGKKFSMDVVVQHKLKPSSIFEYLPVKIHNSNLANTLLYTLQETSSAKVNQIQQNMSLPTGSFHFDLPKELPSVSSSFDALNVRPVQFVEKHLEYLGETIDEYGQEQWRWHGWQRNLAKEQQKLNSLVSKRKQENTSRAAQGMNAAYNEEDLQATSLHLQRLTHNEPSRLESLVICNQIETYCDQVWSFNDARVAKMAAIKAIQ